jgi:hypothetical protein
MSAFGTKCLHLSAFEQQRTKVDFGLRSFVRLSSKADNCPSRTPINIIEDFTLA